MRCVILDTGYWMRDTRYAIPDASFQMPADVIEDSSPVGAGLCARSDKPEFAMRDTSNEQRETSNDNPRKRFVK
jgi:hypothetical protein